VPRKKPPAGSLRKNWHIDEPDQLLPILRQYPTAASTPYRS